MHMTFSPPLFSSKRGERLDSFCRSSVMPSMCLTVHKQFFAQILSVTVSHFAFSASVCNFLLFTCTICWNLRTGYQMLNYYDRIFSHRCFHGSPSNPEHKHPTHDDINWRRFWNRIEYFNFWFQIFDILILFLIMDLVVWYEYPLFFILYDQSVPLPL